jgi:GDPmannose 4,6-dehydratase
MKSAFITGIYGQDGAYLAQHLLKLGYSVTGGARRLSHVYSWRLKILGIEDQIKIVDFDLTDQCCVLDVISTGQFDEIYNLAAQSFVGLSWDLSINTSQVNAMGALYLLDAVKRFSPDSRFYQASTSEMFGKVRKTPQCELTPFNPRSPYGVTKLFAHEMTKNYRENFDLFATSGILFNHESPLRGVEFVTQKIVRGLVNIKKGTEATLRLGNLEAKRDWGFAPEYVKGIHMILQHSKPDDFVLATGKTTSVREFIEFSANALEINIGWSGEGLNETGIDLLTGKPIIVIDKNFYRPLEVGLLLGDSSKVKSELGWHAETNVEKLAEIMVNHELETSHV